MATARAFNALIKKRESIKSKIFLFEKYIDSIEGLLNNSEQLNRAKIIEIKQRIDNANDILTKFDEIQSEIECHERNEDDESLAEREQFESNFYSILSRAKALFEALDSQGDNKQTNRVFHESVKLPEIKLPKFDGTYETWLEFQNVFESLIHNNVNISPIQKFHYLRASLVGTAPQVINSLEFTASNYSIAWNALCDRFSNKHLLIQNHLKAIFNMENIVSASAAKLRFLYENLSKHLSCLNQLGEPTDKWDTLLIFIVSNKLDKFNAQEWEKHKITLSSVTLNDFKDFLKRRASILETVELNFKPQFSDKHSQAHKPRQDNSRGLYSNTNESQTNSKPKYSCYHCKGNHSLFHCPDFLKLSMQDRFAKVKNLNLCENCLKRNHSASDCNWSGCKSCGAKHNTILHEPQNRTNSAVSINTDIPVDIFESHDSSNLNNTQCILSSVQHSFLSTAQVQARYNSKSDHYVTVRALLDCGSQSSFVTTELCTKLKLNKTNVNLAISGINDKLSYANFKCDLNIRSIHDSYSLNLSCFILDNITSDIPDTRIDTNNLNIPIDIQLADPEFFIPKPIDILIGADAFWKLLGAERINLNANSLLHNTQLGWILAGTLGILKHQTSCNFEQTIEQKVQQQLLKFWEVEEINPKTPILSHEEQLCEKDFSENTKLNSDGRYVVSLPLKMSIDNLGESKSLAIKRFSQLERRLMENESLRILYTDFLREYENLNHMTKIKNENDSPEYFMPHHGVLRETSSTTKLRVVFNASASTSSGFSLNDLQMTGPTIQQDILSIILRFRTRPIVLSSDIKMMYRQVLLNPEQRKLQKIVWRENPNDELNTYQLNTVTYGTTAASFLAIRCLHEVARECENQHPKIARIIREDMYVDDLLTSLDSLEEADYVSKIISEYFLKHGFELRKWKSNDKRALINLNSEHADKVLPFSSQTNQFGKTLGLSWSCDLDFLVYEISPPKENKEITKRSILSRIATIFDPLGLVSPCIIIAKVLLQKLWAENLTWDERLPDNIFHNWINFSDNLNCLNDLNISRKVICDEPISISLHGFCDACETGYGACIYIVSKNKSNECFSNLLCAKSKVAPLKSLTMPRLELCGAVILSQLISKVLKSIDITYNSIHCWCDSTIVLGWLKTSPNLLKPFVNNRVAEIQRLTNSFLWHHVPSKDNSADLLSRGVPPNEIGNCDMWWHGPEWLLLDSEEWPEDPTIPCDLPEKRKCALVANTSTNKTFPETFPFDMFSDLLNLKRCAAYVFRFINNARNPDLPKPKLLYLNLKEINNAFEKLIKFSQQESFTQEYSILFTKGELQRSSSILNLKPFMDNNGIIRVGGRLSNSNFSYSKKFPILLGSKHHLTKLIFEHEHISLFHAGPQLLLSQIRETFWAISGRNLARNTYRKCVKCARFNHQTVQPIMGDLPATRVQPNLHFSVVGVDYAGPFTMKDRRGRGCKPIKCWVSLFICFSTRAIHLEIVMSLSAEDFLQAFNRFTSRRGKPSHVYSDNGTNFVKANKDIQSMYKFLNDNASDIVESVANLGIQWHFIPPYSPHFGGIWEAGVKSIKHHIKRTLGNQTLFYFDFQTLLIRIEAVVNSRPITPLTSDPNDFSALTPAHFLIGKPMFTIPEASLQDVPCNRLSQFQLLQQLFQHFWRRWSSEYVTELQRRQKWKSNHGTLKVGQLVLLRDDNQPPMKWRMGRVLSFIMGNDKVPRVCTIKTMDGIVSRSVTRLCPLPVES